MSTNTCPCGHHAFQHKPVSSDGGKTVTLTGPCVVCFTAKRGNGWMVCMGQPAGQSVSQPAPVDTRLHSTYRDSAGWITHNISGGERKTHHEADSGAECGFCNGRPVVSSQIRSFLNDGSTELRLTIENLHAKVAELEKWKADAIDEVQRARGSAAHNEAQKAEWKDHARALERKIDAAKKALG